MSLQVKRKTYARFSQREEWGSEKIRALSAVFCFGKDENGGAQLGAWQYGFFVYGGSFPWRSYDSKTMEHARKNDVEGFTGERFSDYVEDSEKYSAKLMPGMIPTAEEADQVSPFLTDSDSYVQEARMKFVTGQWNFDSDWDAYVNQLNAMGAEDYVTVKQAQYDRYLSK